MAGEVVLIDPQTGDAYKAAGGAGAGAQQVQGNVPSGSADLGNPIKIGGVYRGTPPVLGDNQRTDVTTDNRGALAVAIRGYGQPEGVSVKLAGGSNSNGLGLSVVGFNYVTSNGSTWFAAAGDAVSAFTRPPPLLGTDRSITVTTTSQQLMAANATRARLIIKNDTATAVFFNLGATAVATPGGGNFQIAPNGGYFELAGYNGAVNIISTASVAVSAREM